MKYLKITSPDINNGLGCRVTMWLPGCTHNCLNCHNKWTHNYNQGIEFDSSEESKIYELVDKPYIKGLTISGGDPLDQSESILNDLLDFIKRFREKYGNKKDIWVYTGFKIEELNQSQLNILENCDILVDGRYEENLRDITLPFRGSSNQRIIDLKKYFAKKY